MTEAINKMLVTVRRELVAWFLAGAALRWIIKDGFNRWTMAAIGVSLGIGAANKRRRKPPEEK